MDNLMEGIAQPQVSYSMSSDQLNSFAESMKAAGRNEAIAEIERRKLQERPMLSRKEAMRQLGISESTIIQWGKRHLLRKVKHGHACFYFQEDIDNLLIHGTEK